MEYYERQADGSLAHKVFPGSRESADAAKTVNGYSSETTVVQVPMGVRSVVLSLNFLAAHPDPKKDRK